MVQMWEQGEGRGPWSDTFSQLILIFLLIVKPCPMALAGYPAKEVGACQSCHHLSWGQQLGLSSALLSLFAPSFQPGVLRLEGKLKGFT
jgi:hypothetical protein